MSEMKRYHHDSHPDLQPPNAITFAMLNNAVLALSNGRYADRHHTEDGRFLVTAYRRFFGQEKLGAHGVSIEAERQLGPYGSGRIEIAYTDAFEATNLLGKPLYPEICSTYLLEKSGLELMTYKKTVNVMPEFPPPAVQIGWTADKVAQSWQGEAKLREAFGVDDNRNNLTQTECIELGKKIIYFAEASMFDVSPPDA
jgi:hypothetical protein